MAQSVALEINYEEIKGIGVKLSYAGQSLSQHVKAPLSNESPEKNSQSIIEFIKTNFPNNNGLYLNLPAKDVFIREISVPFIDPKKIKEVIPFELESFLPFELTDIVFDYYSYPDLETKKSRVIVLGVQKSSILPYLHLFKRNNIAIAGLYAPLDALYSLFQFSGQSSGVLLHISPLTTMLVVVEEHQWVYARTLPLGYDVLIHWLSQKTGQDFNDSKKFLTNLPAVLDSLNKDILRSEYDIPKSKAKIILKTLDLFSEKLSQEVNLSIQSALQYTEKEFSDFPIMLSSELENQRLLANLLSVNLSVPLTQFPFDQSPLATIPKDFSIAVGGAYSQNKGMKFLQGDLKKLASVKKSRQFLPFAILAGVGLLAFLVAFALGLVQKSKRISALTIANKKLFKKYFPKVRPKSSPSLSAQALKKLNEKKSKNEVFQKFLRGPHLKTLLIELNSKLVDPSLKINNLNYNGSSLKFSGVVDKLSTVDSLVDQLNTSKYFSKVTKSGVRSAPGAGGVRITKFTMSLAVVEVDPKYLEADK